MDLALRIVATLLVSGGAGTLFFSGRQFRRRYADMKAASNYGERILAQVHLEVTYPPLFIGAMLIIVGTLYFVVT